MASNSVLLGLTLPARLGRQGKRPALGPAHVVGKIEEFANVANTPCWRFRQIVQGFQASERRRLGSAWGAGT